MGWTWYRCGKRKANGKPDAKAEIDGFLNTESMDVLKSAMVGATYYAAVRDKSDGEVWAAVFLTSTDGRSYYDFGYKDMEESMGPCQHECPESILDLLTPTDNPYALRWREDCRKSLRHKRVWAAIPDGKRYIWTVPSNQFRGLAEGERVVIYKRALNPYKKRSKKVWIIERFGSYIPRTLVDLDMLEPIAD